MSASGIRKQVYLLSSEYFKEHPIWEFCSDEESDDDQDEATVRPSELTEILGYSPGAYVVAADVTYASGKRAEGYIYSGEPNDFGCIQPNILLPAEQVNLWLGSLRFIPNWKEMLTKNVNLLGGITGLFPMSFKARANINSAPFETIVPAFLALETNNRFIELS